MKKNQWQKAVKDMEKGKSYEEVTRYVPLAVNLKHKRFKNQISSKQMAAVRRG